MLHAWGDIWQKTVRYGNFCVARLKIRESPPHFPHQNYAHAQQTPDVKKSFLNGKKTLQTKQKRKKFFFLRPVFAGDFCKTDFSTEKNLFLPL